MAVPSLTSGYHGKVLEIAPDQSGQTGQKTASLLGQTLTLLKAKLAIKDDVLRFIAESSSGHQLRQWRALDRC